MMSDWRFDERNPFAVSFENSLLELVDSSLMADMIKMKCNEIRKDPKANLRGFVGGRFVYIAKTGPVTIGKDKLEPLLVVYTLDEQQKLIQRVFVCKAGTVGESAQPVAMGAMGDTLRRAIQRALANARDDAEM